MYVQKDEATTYKYRASNVIYARVAKVDWQMEMDIYWDGEKLDLLDCAFFAAVLSIIRGVAEPPYKIDSQLKPAREDRRLGDAWSFYKDHIEEEQSDREEASRQQYEF